MNDKRFDLTAINKMKNTVSIHGNRWFDKSGGNTYHTVSVSVNGTFIKKSGMTYGYGDAYQQTALKILFDMGIFIKSDSEGCFTIACRDRDFKYYITVSDGRKKDL